MFWMIVMLVLSYGDLAGSLTQAPISSVTKLSKSVRFKCTVDSKDTAVHWYQHREGQAPSRILYYDSSVIRDQGFGNRFKADKQNTVCTLIINDIVKEDAATYYCAYWDSTVFNRDRNA
ncbi:hypothetical protein chiPu_0000082 [Chiloscyllium punctatum]|uniref:Ig-like domain-containing protein n=1 Tax=Chiloscyllium punctatum TaxID=137246 RepID=A0A401RN13_CHIPU|nr:hypothetical protein [Chiloscyllium punctatum]